MTNHQNKHGRLMAESDRLEAATERLTGAKRGPGRPAGSTIPDDQRIQQVVITLRPEYLRWLQDQPGTYRETVEAAIDALRKSLAGC